MHLHPRLGGQLQLPRGDLLSLHHVRPKLRTGGGRQQLLAPVLLPLAGGQSGVWDRIDGARGALQPVHVPLGCLLRATHRQAIAKHQEHCLLSVLVETFCWGCSMAQVHKYLKEHPGEFKSTSSVLGLINSMADDEQHLNRNGSG